MMYKTLSIHDKYLELIYNESMDELNIFFGIDWVHHKPRLVVVDNRKQIDAIKDEKTEDWIVGWAEGKTVYVLDRNNFEKESSHKYDDQTYKALIKHELSHLFYSIVSNNSKIPVWLNEGVAIYTSGQNKFKKRPTEFKNFLKFYEVGGSGVYNESGYVVEILVDKFGKDKVLEFIKSLRTFTSENDFNKGFKVSFGFDLSYDNFTKLL
jgi:hypothetical protein